MTFDTRSSLDIIPDITSSAGRSTIASARRRRASSRIGGLCDSDLAEWARKGTGNRPLVEGQPRPYGAVRWYRWSASWRRAAL